jgi:alpha-ketoglutarate-dependent taurine dioxygenase
MVTVYAENQSWAITQLLAAHKLAGRNPTRKISVIDAPPREKPPLGIRNLPNTEIIDARDGVVPEVLKRLRDRLGL